MLGIIFPIHNTKLFGRKLVHYQARFPQYKNFSSLIFRSRAEWQDVDFPTQCTFWSYLIISVVTAHPIHNGMKSFSEEASTSVICFNSESLGLSSIAVVNSQNDITKAPIKSDLLSCQALPSTTVKLRAIKQPTIQFWTLLDKGHSRVGRNIENNFRYYWSSELEFLSVFNSIENSVLNIFNIQ